MTDRLLVIGAREGSLGEAITDTAAQTMIVSTAGMSSEDFLLDARNHYAGLEIFANNFPAVVCTVGINQPRAFVANGFPGDLERHMSVNAVGPLCLLHYWASRWYELGIAGHPMPEQPLHFVMVSSNSAQIARSNSAPYCASKAALSMGVRCAAREFAGLPMNIWGVEPGWIDGTPMSQDITGNFGGRDLHRIPGNRTVDKYKLADFIVEELSLDRGRFAGQMVRMDGGEQ